MEISREINILFIGNSYTYFNNLPGILESFAKTSKGGSVKTKMIVGGGLNLKMHWNAGKALKEIRRGKYDYVVLQEQSRLGGGYSKGILLIGNPKTFFEYSRRFDREIKKSGAKTVFFLTWAAEILPKDAQGKLNLAYGAIAKELRAILVPVGPLWQMVRRKKPEIELYQSDRAHPSSIGTYLIVCIFYATLFKKSPIGLPFISYESKSQKIPPHQKSVELNPKVAHFLQTMASKQGKNK
jgi:hypothetical protein